MNLVLAAHVQQPTTARWAPRILLAALRALTTIRLECLTVRSVQLAISVQETRQLMNYSLAQLVTIVHRVPGITQNILVRRAITGT